MVGLIDLAPSVETVSVHDKAVAVHGISAKGLAVQSRGVVESV